MLQTLSRISLPPLLVLAALTAYRFTSGALSPAAPEHIVVPRNEPAVIAPQYNEPRLCTDQQLAEVLGRVKPPGAPVNTNNMVHALRLWGKDADFGDPTIPTGKEMLGYFLDDAIFQQWAGKETPSLFFVGDDGIQPRIFDDGGKYRPTSSYHPDDLLATLAEVGTSLDTPMHLRGSEAKVAELLDDSMRRFYLDRLEFEWSAISYVRYLYPLKQWRNKYGERMSVESLVKELMEKAPEAGPCDGLHRLEAMVLLYRVDEAAQAAGQKSILSKKDRGRMLGYMNRVSELLVAAQSPEGYWTRQWSKGAPPAELNDEPVAKAEENGDAKSDTKSTAKPKADPKAKSNAMHDKLLVTGHQLEWLALAPEQVQPPRENIV
ncbi:MAG: hypothetical protein K8R36_15515, partial [Planctomycetales bacterium]|nr:hypothetical protein [Planctomycetales bacterium]